MTLRDVITAVQKEFPTAKSKVICSFVVDLEEKLCNEILLPAGIVLEKHIKNPNDIDAELILEDNNFMLYVSYILSLLALNEKDFSLADVYANLFNNKFSEFATFTRRNFVPAKNTPILVGNLQ